MLKGLSFKVFSLGLLGLIGLLVVGGIYSFGNSLQTTQVNLANGANIHVANALRLKNALLSARGSERDFLLTSDPVEIDRHAKIAEKFEATSREIEAVARRAGGIDVADAAKALLADFTSHNQEFQRLFKLRSELGLKPDQGLEGALRGSVHDIEKKLAESNNADLTADMLMMRRHEKDFMLRKDDKYLAQMKDAAAAFSSALSASALSDDVKKQIKGLAEVYLRNFAAWSEKAKEVDKLDGQLMASANRMEPVVDFIVDAIDKVAKGAAARQQAISSTTSTVIIISIAVAALAVMLLSWLVGRAIVRPLRLMTNTMTSLAGGNLDVVVEGTTRADEIGSMAKAVEIFKANAIDNRRMEQEAEDNRKRGEAERIAMQQKAEADAAERLRIATAGLAAGLKRLASGDLSFQLNEAFSAEFEALRHDFNQSVSQLGSTMKAIAQTVSIMDDGTREIASGADDLSRRTEQQAASLEETAAAVEEITANVANSTTRAQEARTVANRANESAVKSAHVVSQTEDAMREIETSSQKISNIIGVIDEIAFQTNLLALNAGVEAARAGEAGKGFAVVAQEVRELAQRAAGAAKEIKSLIQNSSSQVENGVKLVRGTSEALKQIGDFIVEMNSHMESIATSAMEQSTGLKEVNEAVNAMDQTTQQNAAMVEQSNAASTSLAQEAAKLRDLVGQFQLEVGATQSVAALRQTAAAMAQPQRAPAPAPRQMSSRPAAAGATRAQNWEEF